MIIMESSIPSFSPKSLIDLLEKIVKGIKDNNLNRETQENIWSALTGPIDPLLVKYLFTGFWIHENLSKIIIDDASEEDIEKLRQNLPQFKDLYTLDQPTAFGDSGFAAPFAADPDETVEEDM
jgi:hypothetical protein